MDRVTAYDDDIYAWSQEQAEALRRLAASRPDLPNDLDVANIAEEIEDVGKSELHRVESFLELLLRHLLKIASAPKARPAKHWRGEMAIHHRAVVREYRRSMRRSIDLEGTWMSACNRAASDLDGYGDTILPGLPDACPFEIDEIAHPDFDAEQNLRWVAIRKRAEADRS